MAPLYEIIAEKNLVDTKLSELRDILKIEQTDKLAEELVSLIDKRQTLLISIHQANVASSINIAGSSVDISTAVVIRDAIKKKFDYLSDLINNPECKLDKLELMLQRDKYFDEYTLIDMGININDLNVTLN